MTTDSQRLYTSTRVEDVALVPSNAIVIEPVSTGNSASTTLTAESPSREISALILQAFPDAPTMLQVAINESGLVSTAKNPNSTATGLFQVLNGTRDAYHCGDQTIVEESIKCARKIYDAEGFAPWESSGEY